MLAVLGRTTRNAAAGQERLQHGSGSVEQTEHYTDTVPRYAKILKTPFISVEMVDDVSNRGISSGQNGAIQQLCSAVPHLEAGLGLDHPYSGGLDAV